MKTFFQLIVLFILSTTAFAQQNELPSSLPLSSPKVPSRIKIDSKAINKDLEKLNKHNNTRSSYDNWLNYAFIRNTDLNLGGPYFEPMLVFPDSNIIYGVSNGTQFHPLYHSAATILDPYSLLDDPDLTLSSAATYNLDSVLIKYAYIRTLPTDIVDTLVLSVIKDVPGYWYSTLTGNGDTVRWKFVGYDYTVNNVPDSLIWGQRIVYTFDPIKDTTQISPSGIYNFKPLSFAVNGVPTLGPGVVVGLSVTFKPGYTYSLANNDSIFGKNAFFLLSSEENGQFTDQSVNDPGDFNASYVATNTDRYFDTIGNSKSFAIQYYPAIGYSSNFGFENHIIYFHITSNNTGVKDLSVSNGMDFFPNPTNESANFKYSLSRNAKQVTYKVYDVTGKEMLNMNEGAQQAGVHQFSFKTSNLVPGMYFYTFMVDGQIGNGKFIVD